MRGLVTAMSFAILVQFGAVYADLPSLEKIAGRSLVAMSEYEQIRFWELKHRVIEIILQQGTIANCDSSDAMVLHLLSTVLMNAENGQGAVDAWRLLAKNKEHAVSSKHRAVLALDKDDIEQLYHAVKALVTDAGKIDQDLAVRCEQHKIFDALQHSFQPTERNFNQLKNVGICSSVLPECVPVLRQCCETAPDLPLLDQLKNQRILTVNGLANSKAAFMVHDLFDHFWLLCKLEEYGFLTRYKDFFDGLGDFVSKDIFSRESELVSSIGFEYRLSLVSNDYQPVFCVQDIKNILHEAKIHGLSTNNQDRALVTLTTVFGNHNAAKALEIIYSGVIVELMEQRRKDGCIKLVKNNTMFDAFDPEYTALIVETCALLLSDALKAQDVIVRIALCAEEYLRNVAFGRVSGPLVATIDTCESDYERALPHEVAAWFAQHSGFAGTREVLSNKKITPREAVMDALAIEYEIRFTIEPEEFKKLLVERGATLLVPNRLMKRKTFELGANSWGRVRDEGNCVTMTIKRLSDGTKIEGVSEIEIKIDNFTKGCLLLESLGLKAKSYQENYREEWLFMNCSLALDQWPGLPMFVEIEGASAQQVHEACSALGLNTEEGFFGSIDLMYERFLGIEPVIFNRLPLVTFESFSKKNDE
ncbi:hypothetical protein K2X40_01435 [Candidatus Babeliales bacterium]|nr:hypothetical protein [Candidatus Babeliales bacterium]